MNRHTYPPHNQAAIGAAWLDSIPDFDLNDRQTFKLYLRIYAFLYCFNQIFWAIVTQNFYCL